MPERVRLKLLHPAIGLAALPLREGEVLVLGRGGADVDLGWDTQVSRRHARIGLRGGSVFIEDLDSRNGTWVGRSRIHGPRGLALGDEVLIGDTVVRVAPAHEADPFAEVTGAELGHPGPSVDPVLSTMDLRQSTADLRVIAEPIDFLPPVEAVPGPAPVAPAAAAPLYGRASSPGIRGLAPAPPVRSLAPAPPTTRPGIVAEPTRIGPAPEAPKLSVELHGAELYLEYSTEAAFRAAFRAELSRGTVVCPTALRRPIGTRLHTALRQPGGALQFEAQVIQELPVGSMGLPAGGLALQILGLDRDTIRALTTAEPAKGFELLSRALVRDARQPTMDAAFDRARLLIAAMERGDFYGALDVTPDATDEAIRARVQVLEQSLMLPKDAPETPQVARIRAAQERVSRLSQALTDPMRRLEHDFRAGHVRAMDRIARARIGVGFSLEVLRRVWHQVHPVRVDRAAFLTRKAFTSSQAGDFEGAIKAARGALEENPFFDELRPTIEGWERSRIKAARHT